MNPKCPYCDNDEHVPLVEHPYPYKRTTKDGVLLVLKNKYTCTCGYSFFDEIRRGVDMEIKFDNNLYYQIYKQGFYQYKNVSTFFIRENKSC